MVVCVIVATWNVKDAPPPPPRSPSVTVITSVAECPSPPFTIVIDAAPVSSIIILNLCPVPEPPDEPFTSLYVPAVLLASAADIDPTVAITPDTALSLARLVPPDVCSLVAIHKPPPYLTTSFTLYLVFVW